jgi:FkbM family methyltransferase
MLFHDIIILKKIKFIRYFYFLWLKRIAQKNTDKEVVSKIFFDLKMLLTLKDWVQFNLFIYGQYEDNETKLVRKLCRNESVFFDIGANVGYYSLIAGKTNKNNRVYAFEPVKRTFERAAANIKLNHLNNIFLYKKIISNTTELASINVGNESNWGMSSLVQHEHLSGDIEKVESITLDNFVKEQKITRLDLVKIDVEGFELNVLEGMKETLIQFKPIILIEILDHNLAANGNKPEDIYNFLWQMGYFSYKILSNKLEQIHAPESYHGLIYFAQN